MATAVPPVTEVTLSCDPNTWLPPNTIAIVDVLIDGYADANPEDPRAGTPSLAFCVESMVFHKLLAQGKWLSL